MAAGRKLARHKLDLVDVSEVRWDERSTVRVGDNNFSHGKGNKIINWEQVFLHHKILSSVKRVEFLSDRSRVWFKEIAVTI